MTSPTWDPDKGPSDSQVDDARRVLRADYWTSIRGMVADVIGQMKGGHLESADEVSDYIHESADGCHWAIYTHANYQAIMCSDHDPWEDVEDQGSELDPKNAMPVLAYFCVKHDVEEQLEAELGQSPDDWFTEKADAEEDESEGVQP